MVPVEPKDVSDFAKQLLHLIKMFAIVKEGGRSREEEGTACVGGPLLREI